MNPFINIAVKAARKAGDVIIKSLGQWNKVTVTEKTHNDFVTSIDKASEAAIIKTIHQAYPKHSIWAEESGSTEGENSKITWIIDPIDGTTNFIHQIPHYCISIAVQIGSTIEHGVIYNPISQELFTASRGEGAQLNNQRMRVSKNFDLSHSLIATGMSFAEREKKLPALLKNYVQVLNHSAAIRGFGSAALNLAYTACGRVDGYFESGLQPWDMAAGLLMVQEAGGYISDFQGENKYLETGQIIAGNRKIYSQIRGLVE